MNMTTKATAVTTEYHAQLRLPRLEKNRANTKQAAGKPKKKNA
jgi:hypothetical protein